MAQEKFEKIRVDLRPFGWGIRDVDVIWPEGHDCKCEDGPDAGQGGGMEEDDEEAGPAAESPSLVVEEEGD